MSDLFETPIRGRATEFAKTMTQAGVPKRVVDLHRNTQRLPQAVIKVSSYAKSQSRAVAHASYMTRHEKAIDDLPIEMSDGTVLRDHEEVQAVIDDWFTQDEVRSNARRTVNIVLSSPAGTDVEQLKASVRDFSGAYFQAHDSMFVIHTDTPNPHAHLTVKTRSHHGEQLRLGRAELKDMKDVYAESLRKNGVEVQSSYRSDRGQWTPGVTQAVHHLRQADVEQAKAARFDFKLLAPDDLAQASLTRCYQRTQNEYLGAALFLRQAYGASYQKEAKALEAYGLALAKPAEQERSSSTDIHQQPGSSPAPDADFDR